MNQKTRTPDTFIAYGTVAVQFGCLIAIFASGPLLAQSLLWRTAEFAGVGLGLWAIGVMRIGNFNITPTVVAGGEFVARGPYRYIRHPMYTSLLMTTLPLIADRFSPLRLLIWLLLLADLVIKLLYEEKQLIHHYPAYGEYQKSTYRLLPFLW